MTYGLMSGRVRLRSSLVTLLVRFSGFDLKPFEKKFCNQPKITFLIKAIRSSLNSINTNNYYRYRRSISSTVQVKVTWYRP